MLIFLKKNIKMNTHINISTIYIIIMNMKEKFQKKIFLLDYFAI